MNQTSRADRNVRNDRWLLAISMVISLTFWLVLKMSQIYTYNYTVAVEYQLPEGYAFRQAPPSGLTISLEGKGWDLMRFHLFKRHHPVPFRITTTTDHNFLESSIKNRLNNTLNKFKLNVKSSTPPIINIQIDPRVTKKVPLLLKGNVYPATGLRLLAPPRLKPDSVSIQGAQSLLAKIEQWYTDSIEVSVQSAMEITVPVRLPDNDLLEISPKEVALIAETESLVEDQLYVPITILHAPEADSLFLFPESVLVKFSLGISHYGSAKTSDFEVVADFSGIQPGSEQTTLALQLTRKPDYVESASFSPASVSFRFFFKKKEEESTAEK